MLKIGKKYFIVLIVIMLQSFVSFVSAQNISFLTDYLGNVSVFDNGKMQDIEHQPLRSYKIGNNAMAYETNSGNFKIYSKHFVHNCGVNVDDYKVSNNYIVFSYKKILKLFDNNKIILLSLSSPSYFVGTNMVIWYDDVQHSVKAYCNEKFYDLDDALATDLINKMSCANNIATFVDSRNYLNIFYNKEVFPIDFSERVSEIKCGKNLVAFVYELNNSFQCLYFGELTEIENFRPASFKTADDFVAYIDANGYFKVFRDFGVETLDFNTPDFYECKNDIMVFGVQNYFKAYLNSRVFTLESRIPDTYYINNNVCAWIDQQGFLKYFNGEKIETVSYETIKDFELNGNILKYKYGVGSETIYFNGKKYNN